MKKHRLGNIFQKNQTRLGNISQRIPITRKLKLLENEVCKRFHRILDSFFRLRLGVEDTGTPPQNLLFLLFSTFFCSFVPYCLTSTVSSTPGKSRFLYSVGRCYVRLRENYVYVMLVILFSRSLYWMTFRHTVQLVRLL